MLEYAGTYSSGAFHCAAHEIITSHGFEVGTIGHGEPQYDKGEIDAGFSH